MNEGVFNAIDWVIPDGLVVSATYPAPISGMASTVVSKTIDNVYRCFIQPVPDKVMCAQNNLLNIVVSGPDQRPGHDKPFILYMWLDGGWGARPAKKDNCTAQALFASTTKNIPIERLEKESPVLFEQYEYLPDSEGAGRHRGGFGIVKSFRLTHGDGKLGVQGDRGETTPWGHAGGDDGPTNTLVYAPGTPEEKNIGVFAADFPVRQDKLVRVTTCGGGGYGRPSERPVEWVLEDVIAGLVSVDKAERVYGVRLNVGDAQEVDEDATRALRAEMAAQTSEDESAT
jgi:N-methylhydantoinase B